MEVGARLGGHRLGPDRSRGQIGGPEVLSGMEVPDMDGVPDSRWTSRLCMGIRSWMGYQIGVGFQVEYKSGPQLPSDPT